MDNNVRNLVEDFFSSFPEVHYPKDQILLFPGESVSKVFHITEGRVCQYSISYRGDEIIVNTFKPPAFFPMSLAINDLPSNFFYKTEAPTTIRVAPTVDVLAFLHSEPAVTYNLLSRVYSGIESVLERMVHLMSGTARSRLIFELIIEFRRFGNKTKNSGYLEVSEASVAARAGLSRETVSREMKHLKDKRLVEMRSGKIHINDVSSLEKQLGLHV